MNRYFIIFFTAVLCLASVSCTKEGQSARADGKLKIVCTTSMLADLMSNIGGDRVDVISIMGPGVDPHQFKATPGTIRNLYDSDLIIYHGLHLEAKMAELFSKMGKSRATAGLADRLPKSLLIKTGDESYDPHIWFDVKIWKRMALLAADVLSGNDKKFTEYFRQRTENYLKKLDSLELYVIDRAAELKPEQRVLITAHDAFGYFANAYGFEVEGLQGISTESEAGARDVTNLVNLIVRKQIKAIFIESSVPVKNIKAVQDAVRAAGRNVEIGGELFSDSMGSAGTEEGNYIGMVKHNINTIVNALKGN